MSISALSTTESSSSLEELLKALREKKAPAEDSPSAISGTLDADASGGLSLEESGLDQDAYDALDADQDGTVSLKELEAALALQQAAFLTNAKLAAEGEGADSTAQSSSSPSTGAGGGAASGQTSFDDMDTNQDGVVSSEELATALERRQEAATGSSARTGRQEGLRSASAGRAYGAGSGESGAMRHISATA